LEKRKVVGFDINTKPFEQLKKGKDFRLESKLEELMDATYLTFSSNP